MESDNDQQFLSNLSKLVRLSDLKADHISRLISSFSPSFPSATRTGAFIALTSICARQTTSGTVSESDAEAAHRSRLFLAEVERRMSDVEEKPALEAIVFITALFTVDWHSASTIFNRDGFKEGMMDLMDIYPSSGDLHLAVAALLAQASGYKTCRATFDEKTISWLESSFKHAKDSALATKATLALIKLSRVSSGNDSLVNSSSGESELTDQDEEFLEQLTMVLVKEQDDMSEIADAIEGLAYLSTDPDTKERIVKHPLLVARLVSFGKTLHKKGMIPSVEQQSTICYGLASIVANLCSYRPRLTEEQAQLEKLRKMTNAGNKEQSMIKHSKDDDDHVLARGKILVNLGAVDLLSSVVRASESIPMRKAVGRAMLGLVEARENRGKILQSGGSKTLMIIIRAFLQSLPVSSPLKSSLDPAYLATVQALAKLAITSSPLQVFGPDENVTIEAIRPFVYLLVSESSTLLQRFEALMALTNLASSGVDVADRIAKFEGLMNKLEFLLLDENVMVRRAATELLCNLVAGSEHTFQRYAGEDCTEASGSQNAAKSRLHILVALADVEDEATRLASSGALAVITSSSTACRLLMMVELEQHHHVLGVFKQLIDPIENGANTPTYHQGLLHRGVVCVRNLLMNLTGDVKEDVAKEAEKHGLVKSLVELVKSSQGGNMTEVVLRPALEALKCLMEAGVNVAL